MATNKYFKSSYSSDRNQSLIDNLNIQAIQQYGIDMLYLPRSYVNLDRYFGEDSAPSEFDNAYVIEMYLKNVDGWGGENEFLSKFGLEIQDEVTFTCSVTRFKEEVSDVDPNIIVPREGDLIAAPKEIDKRQRLFEISFVEDEESFYQLGKLYTYEIRCKPFAYAGESFDTGIDEIDEYNSYGNNTMIRMSDDGNQTGTYTQGEVVSQATGTEDAFAGLVLSWNEETNEIVLTNTVGYIKNNYPLIGETSGASWNIETVESETHGNVGDNDFFDDQDDEIIDFSEKDPFSEG